MFFMWYSICICCRVFFFRRSYEFCIECVGSGIFYRFFYLLKLPFRIICNHSCKSAAFSHRNVLKFRFGMWFYFYSFDMSVALSQLDIIQTAYVRGRNIQTDPRFTWILLAHFYPDFNILRAITHIIRWITHDWWHSQFWSDSFL